MNPPKSLNLIYLLYFFIFTSCATEKPNISPTRNMFANVSQKTPESIVSSLSYDLDLMQYSAKITNAFSHNASYTNEEVNAEITDLKHYLTEYLYAVKEFNTVEKDKAFFNYEKSYKKLQRLKSKLSEDEQDILNRFLVNIKTNVSLIESLKNTP